MTPLPGQELQYIFLNQHRLTLERLRDNDSPWKPPAGVNARPSLPSLPRSGAASLSVPWEDLLILIQGQERGVLPGAGPLSAHGATCIPETNASGETSLDRGWRNTHVLKGACLPDSTDSASQTEAGVPSSAASLTPAPPSPWASREEGCQDLPDDPVVPRERRGR